MRILLDTPVFLWLSLDSPLLSEKAKTLFLDPQNEFYLSLVSVFKITTEISLGKLRFHKAFEPFLLDSLQENAIQLLNIEFRHVARIATLSFHHSDPLDRLLISQALDEKMPLLSNDPLFDSYSIERLW